MRAGDTTSFFVETDSSQQYPCWTEYPYRASTCSTRGITILLVSFIAGGPFIAGCWVRAPHNWEKDEIWATRQVFQYDPPSGKRK